MLSRWSAPIPIALLLLPGAFAPAAAQVRDPVQVRVPTVISDTPEYCGVLKNRIDGLAQETPGAMPAEVAELSMEGERMCEHGHIRGGLLRLRRAIAILRHPGN